MVGIILENYKYVNCREEILLENNHPNHKLPLKEWLKTYNNIFRTEVYLYYPIPILVRKVSLHVSLLVFFFFFFLHIEVIEFLRRCETVFILYYYQNFFVYGNTWRSSGHLTKL